MKKIILMELNFRREAHLNANAGFVQAHRQCFPDTVIHLVADDSHIKAIKRALNIDTDLVFFEHNIDFEKAQGSISRSGFNYYLAPFKRLLFIYSILRKIKAEQNDRVFFLSNTELDFFAVFVIKKILLRKIDVSLVCHGNLNLIHAWESNNPIRKYMNYRNSLKRLALTDIKLIVFEQFIKNNLLKEISMLKKNVSLIFHPFLCLSVVKKAPIFPFRIAYVGEVNTTKRFYLFEKLAINLNQVCKDRFVFDVIGRSLQLDMDCSFYALKPSNKFLDSKEMERLILNVDLICMFHETEYYSLSPSGIFADAIRFLKPIIHLNSELVIYYETQFGTLGVGGENIAEISHKLQNLTKTDYVNMRHNLEKLKAGRGIEKTAASLLSLFDNEAV
ncbi:MAG: hypothetical protein ACJA13_000905 [Paraglaciecola sp.]|jgi:hypothetical protein